jgi:hypothetical protein
MKILAVEQAFGSHHQPYLLSNGTPIFGFIDLVVEHEDGTIELIDYKSQWKPIKQEEADSDIQAGMYLTVASEIWPDRPIRFTFDLLRYGTVTTIWPDEKIAIFKDWLKTKYDWIESVTDPQATIGNNCKWCSFVDVCPKAQDLIQNGSWDLVVGEDPTDQSRDEMLDALARIKAAKTLLDKKQRQINDEIKQGWFDNNAGGEPVETDKWVVSYDKSERQQFIPSEVQRIVGTTAFGQMATISKSAVERVLPILPEDVADEVQSSAILKPFRQLNVRRRKHE